MECLDNDALNAFLAGELTAEACNQVDDHLDQCSACRRLVSRIASTLPHQPASQMITRADCNVAAEPQGAVAGPLVNREIGNFRVVGFLGAGAMGTVYLGEHKLLGHQVAIKVMQGGLEGGSGPGSAVDRFFSEARALTEIEDDAHIARLHDFGRLDDDPSLYYYVMEFMKGHDLERELQQHGPLSPVQVLPYLRQICAGLQAAHDSRILHRDLKPSNIFVLEGQPVRVKLLDFGLAKRLGSDQKLTFGGMGSPIYAAPELVRGQQQQIGPRTDLYSLGVTLYKMLSGQLPFEIPQGLSPYDLIMLPLEQDPVPLRRLLPTLSRPVARIVDQCLTRDPQGRPRSAADVLDAFEQAVGTSSEPADLPLGAPAARGRSGVWVAALGAAGVLAAIVGLVLSFGHGGKNDANRIEPGRTRRAPSSERSVEAGLVRSAAPPPAAPTKQDPAARVARRPKQRPARSGRRSRRATPAAAPGRTQPTGPDSRGPGRKNTSESANWIMEPNFNSADPPKTGAGNARARRGPR
jgi:eukaryotic-like serine/threonine-protein kinase